MCLGNKGSPHCEDCEDIRHTLFTCTIERYLVVKSEYCEYGCEAGTIGEKVDDCRRLDNVGDEHMGL